MVNYYDSDNSIMTAMIIMTAIIAFKIETIQNVQTVQTEYFFSNTWLTFFASNDKIVFNMS